MKAVRSFRSGYRASAVRGRATLSGTRVTHGKTAPDRDDVIGPRPKKLRETHSREELAAMVAEIEAEKAARVSVRWSGKKPACPECGVTPPGRGRDDGTRRHRIRVDDPTAPWCSASPPDRTD